MKPKCGTRREDGMVFWRLHKTKGEVWITEDQYQRRCAQEKQYRQQAYADYKKRLEKIPPHERPYLGKYCPRRDLYYLCVSSSGKETWVTKNRLDRFRERSKRAKRKHINKLMQIEKTGIKIGDKHPNDPNLYVVFFTGNKPYYGTKEHLDRITESRKMTYRKRYIKAKKIRTERLERDGRKYRRGDIDPVTNLIFWEYDRIAKERWLPAEVYHQKRNKELLKRKRSREAQKTKGDRL